ncbi:MAG: amino acid racemase [Candidatus Cloacimonetes bacterium]|nr:amino acid racemase [Candidatus Cloacimonadota bacterium]
MKTIGLIGGITWKSTKEYYRIINELTANKLGGLHSAAIILYSFDFHQIKTSDPSQVEKMLIEKARMLENSGAEILLLCVNTLHKHFEAISRTISIPMIHIADAAGRAIAAHNLARIGLLGTQPTMEEDFYIDRLKAKFGFKVLTPKPDERIVVNAIIFDELVKGIISQESKAKLVHICQNLVNQGAQGIILGCTELPFLLDHRDLDIPIFNTVFLQAAAAVDLALN